MHKLASPPAVDTIAAPVASSVADDVVRVCGMIPPLWDLANYVAVNPFLGFADQPIAEAARIVSDGIGAQVLPAGAFYRERWRSGALTADALERAAQRAGQSPAALAAILDGTAPMPLRPAGQSLTFAERHDYAYGSDWHARVIRHVALWCSVYIPTDGPAWAATDASLYAAWREAAQHDRSLEIHGLAGWCDWVRALPPTPEAATVALLAELGVPPAKRAAYLYRLLGGLFGWAALLRRASWEVGDTTHGPLSELLAVRLCADAAVARLASRAAAPHAAAPRPAVEDECVRAIFQEALEDGYAHRLLGALAAPPDDAYVARPAVQAIFCIDVRSEILRRHLEAQAPAVQTLGFAGFFGISLEWQADGAASARCPVLLKPAVALRAHAAAPPSSALKKLQSAPAAAFTFVETLGLGYAIGLIGDALGLRSAPRADEGATAFGLDDPAGGIAPAERVELAIGILKNSGLGDRLARLVLLCGHAGRSENNPHQAGLDCGACGGHGGAINARVAAALLNDQAVRVALRERGLGLPDDSYVLPAVHDTSTDEVQLLDSERVPASHQAELAQLRGWLDAAGAATRAERAAALGLSGKSARQLAHSMRRRARDWSEVRPEWALARNAAFIAGRRGRTRGVDLEGRAFLHEYDWTADPDGSVLTLILTAPMVVASWINLQYFASSVDNAVFGSGTKALHNRVGTLGVVLGNGGDLRTGLALQSLQAADGSLYHEPLRLQVVVEAPHERIEAVVAAQPGVRDLVENGWVRLFALDPGGSGAARWVPGNGWAVL